MKTKRLAIGVPRRGFLAGMALAGASLGASPAPTAGAACAGGGALPRRTLGSGAAALEVSALGFGCMGLNYHRGPHPDRKQAIRLVREAAERGVTLFDTAEGYGPYTNEALLGEALRGVRAEVFVATKFGHKYMDGRRVMDEEDSSPANIRGVCEASLRRLGVEAIGIFYQHRIDPKTPIEVVAETVRALIREGKVLRFGLCEVNAETIRRAHAVCPVTAVQSEYHLLHRAVEAGVLPICAELGIGFVPYSPLNRGFLGGGLTEWTVFDAANDNRRELPRFTPAAMRANLRIVEALHAFGRTRGMTAAQIALAWLLACHPWVVPIPGTTKRAHLAENLGAAAFRLSPGERRALEAAVAAYPVVGARYNAEQAAKVQQ